MRRTRQLATTMIAGLASLGALIGFVVGVPLLLLRIRPNPLPEQWPTFDRIVTMAKAGTVDSAVVPNVVAILVWVCWAAMTLCIAAEILGRLRGRTVHIPVLTSGFGNLSKRWVGAIAAMATLTMPQGIAQAGTLTSRLSNIPAATTVGSRTNVVGQTDAWTSSTRSTPSTVAQDSSSESASVLSAAQGRPTFAENDTSMSSSGRVVLVQPGDSYWELADSLTGDGFRWRELLAANVGRTMPDGYVVANDDPMLHPGWELVVPNSWVSSEGQWHERIVQHGDTLAEIAAEEYGAADQWPTIAADNPQAIDDPDLIFPGTALQIRGEVAPPPTAVDPVDSIEPIGSVAPVVRRVDAGLVSIEPTAVNGSPLPKAGSRVETDLDDEGSLSRTAGPVVGFLGISSAVAAAVLFRLKRNRQEQHVFRRVGTLAPRNTALAQKTEVSYRAVANDDHLPWLDAALVAAQLLAARSGAKVQLICAHNGWVEFRLDHPLVATLPFEQHTDNSWKLATDVSIKDVAVSEQSLSSSLPFMLSVGDSTEGSVWICLDDIAVLNVDSDRPDIAHGVLTAWAIQLLAVPWSQERTLVIVGAPESVRRLAEKTHAVCVDAAINIEPKSWLTERVTVLSFLGDESVLAQVSEHQAKRVTVLRASRDDADPAADEIALHVNATALTGTVRPGNLALEVVSFTGPAQLRGIEDLLGAPASVNTHELDHPWDEPPHAVPCGPITTHMRTIDLTDGVAEPSVTVPAPTFEFPTQPTPRIESAVKAIERIMAAKPLELRVLTNRPVVTVEGATPTPSVSELVLYLALCGPTPHDSLLGAVYRTRQVERSAVRQLVWRTRQFVGNVLVGEDTAIALDPEGYALDWDRFVALSDLGTTCVARGDATSALSCWQHALGLVEGLAWHDSSRLDRPGDGEWAIENGLLRVMTQRITDTSTLLARLALEHDRPDLAPWAVHRVLALQSVPNVELVELGLRGAAQLSEYDEALQLQRLLLRAHEDFGAELSADSLRIAESLAARVELRR